jgi:hypothetical protein
MESALAVATAMKRTENCGKRLNIGNVYAVTFLDFL